MIVYDGPSMLDFGMILVVITGVENASRNVKTGEMAQVWILCADVEPKRAVWSGMDAAICGDCKLRAGPNGRACYVNLAWAPTNIWRAARDGRYPRMRPQDAGVHLAGHTLRLGAYGDPAAVPSWVWAALTAQARGWTGYTHQWRGARFRPLQAWCMASVDTPEEASEARAFGWRTFRVRAAGDPLVPALDRREVVCPAAAEGRHKLTCAQCRLCDGGNRAKGPHVAIVAHGSGADAWDRTRRQPSLFARNAGGLSARP